MKQSVLLSAVFLSMTCCSAQPEQNSVYHGLSERGTLFETELRAQLKPADCEGQSANFTACFIAEVCHEKMIDGWREFYPNRIYNYYGGGHIQYPPHDTWIGEGAYRYVWSLFSESQGKLKEYDAYEETGQFDLLERLLVETASGFKLTPIEERVTSIGREIDAVTGMQVRSEVRSFSITFSTSDAVCLSAGNG